MKSKYNTGFIKQRQNTIDKLGRVLKVQANFTPAAFRLLALLELQIQSLLVRAKFVPDRSLACALCIQRLIYINKLQVVHSPFQILALWDLVQVPTIILDRIKYKIGRWIGIRSSIIRKLLYKYWRYFTTYNLGKLWVFSSILSSWKTGEILVFMYPNLLAYFGPFRRYTGLHREERIYWTFTAAGRNRTELHSLLHLRTISYLIFYYRNKRTNFLEKA